AEKAQPGAAARDGDDGDRQQGEEREANHHEIGCMRLRERSRETSRVGRLAQRIDGERRDFPGEEGVAPEWMAEGLIEIGWPELYGTAPRSPVPRTSRQPVPSHDPEICMRILHGLCLGAAVAAMASQAAAQFVCHENNLGTAVGTGDDVVLSQPIGFAFPFHGATYSNLFISTNG